MPSRPLVLDLYCGAGGSAMGWWLAGYDVVGVDNVPQPRFPFPMVVADALTFPTRGFDLISASPPCQAHTTLKVMHPHIERVDLIPQTREKLEGSGLPWVIENVPGIVFVPRQTHDRRVRPR